MLTLAGLVQVTILHKLFVLFNPGFSFARVKIDLSSHTGYEVANAFPGI